MSINRAGENDILRLVQRIYERFGNVDNTADSSKNVASANRATADSSGQNIADTYIKALSVSGRTITYIKGDGATANITTQDTTYSPFSGATASQNGGAGLVPAPSAGENDEYLRGDGTWQPITLSTLGVTVTAAELNYMDGVTSNVQTQLDEKLGEDDEYLKQFTVGSKQTSESISGTVAATTTYSYQFYYITKSDGTSATIQITDTDTKYDVAESDKDGLMSKEDYNKLVMIEEGATKTTIDSALNLTSENPVQNKVITEKFDLLEMDIDGSIEDDD